MRIIPIMKKEVRHIVRDPRTMIMAIAMPLVLIFLFGYAITFDIREIPMVICDMDKTQRSREFIDAFKQCGYFKERVRLNNPNHIAKFLDTGKAKVALIIPESFSRKLKRRQAVEVQVLVDGSDNYVATVAIGYAQAITKRFSSNILLNAISKYGFYRKRVFIPIDERTRILYNPELRSQNFIIPGLIGVIMAMIACTLTALTVAGEWERGTMEQLITTPVKPYEIMVGKFLPYLCIAIFDCLLIMGIGIVFFDVPFKGNFMLLLIFTLLFLTGGLGIGLLVSTATKSQQLSMQISWLIAVLPSIILSGFIFPISSMPKLIQYITCIIPARYFITVLRGIFLKGTGITGFWSEFVFLLILGCATMLISSFRFKKRIE